MKIVRFSSLDTETANAAVLLETAKMGHSFHLSIPFTSRLFVIVLPHTLGIISTYRLSLLSNNRL